MSNQSRATVREIDGQIVLDDPDAREMVGVVHRLNFFKSLPIEDIRRLFNRARGKAFEEDTQFCVVVFDVDDKCWRTYVDLLMPGEDWDVFRAKKMIPVARGVVPVFFVEKLLGLVGQVPPTRYPYIAVFAAGGVTVIEDKP